MTIKIGITCKIALLTINWFKEEPDPLYKSKFSLSASADVIPNNPSPKNETFNETAKMIGYITKRAGNSNQFCIIPNPNNIPISEASI